MKTISQKMKNKKELSIKLTHRYNIVLIKDNNKNIDAYINDTISYKSHYLYTYTQEESDNRLFDMITTTALNRIITMFIEYDSER